MTDTPGFDRLMDARALLLDLRASLRDILSDREQWTVLSGESTGYTPADVAIDDREARIVADAIYALWEGNPYAIRLEQAHAPWRADLLVIVDWLHIERGRAINCACDGGPIVLAQSGEVIEHVSGWSELCETPGCKH